jgi:hypothetical protein
VKSFVCIAVLALPSVALAQNVTVQQAPYPTLPTAPLTLDPTGATAPPQGAPPDPYAPPGSGQVLGTVQPQYITAPPNSIPQPEGAPAKVEGMYLGIGSEVRTAPRDDGAVPATHLVQKGDTLWDICKFYFHDPWRWPEVWGMNPQITNPHWIYPGNVVRLHEGGEAPATPAAPGTTRLREGATDQGGLLRQIAFVGMDDLRAAGTISGSTDEKIMLATGDEVFVSYPDGKPPQVNTRYSIYVPNRDIVEPGTKKVIGKYVVILGEAVITEVKKGKEAKGTITDMTDQGIVERGEKVGPLKTQLRTMTEVPPQASVEGQIAGVLTNTEIVGAGMVVFLDRGRADGVRPGNRMTVVRRGDAYPEYGALTNPKDDRRFPDTDYGSVLVLDVGERTAVGWMARTDTDIQIGDHVLMHSSK